MPMERSQSRPENFAVGSLNLRRFINSHFRY
jgi:hypothetical protein